jgi:hypothetical protein
MLAFTGVGAYHGWLRLGGRLRVTHKGGKTS